MTSASKLRRVTAGALSLALAAMTSLVAVEAAGSQVPPGGTVHYDDIDFDASTDLVALAQLEIVGAPDCAAPAGDPSPLTPAWDARDKANRYCAFEGALDLLRNPTIAEEVQQMQADRAAMDPDGEAGSYLGDPFREPLSRWDGLRGRYDSVRYTEPGGAVRQAAIFRPLDECVGRPASGCTAGLPHPAGPPYPGVILVCHICFPGLFGEAADPWIWAAETLAEAGYMVLTAPVPVEPALDFLLATPDQPTTQGDVNPFWAELDRDRIGLMGHSGAASASLEAGQGDPRVTAIVSWDRSRSFDPRPLEITVPTLLMTGDADYFFFDEGLQPIHEPLGPPAPGTKWADLDLFRQAQVPAMLVSVRAGHSRRSAPPARVVHPLQPLRAASQRLLHPRLVRPLPQRPRRWAHGKRRSRRASPLQTSTTPLTSMPSTKGPSTPSWATCRSPSKGYRWQIASPSTAPRPTGWARVGHSDARTCGPGCSPGDATPSPDLATKEGAETTFSIQEKKARRSLTLVSGPRPARGRTTGTP